MGVHFLRPVRPGRVTTRGRVVHRDGDRATLEATLWDTAGEMSARPTAIAQVIPLARAAGAP
jgi:acyl-coenzyme A thioesterase PaaI-like protein